MTKIKICGITNLPDALQAISAGADLLGFNFYPLSPRSISVTDCASITSIIKKEYPQIILVGVFVNMPNDKIKIILDNCFLHLAQLHGDEPKEQLEALNGRAFKAFRGVPANPSEYTRNSPPALLVDASAKNLYGGSGQTTDWTAAASLAKHLPLLLAGGLTPNNIAKAIQQVKPWGVDTASGVETSPGRKDIDKMLAFVNRARLATS